MRRILLSLAALALHCAALTPQKSRPLACTGTAPQTGAAKAFLARARERPLSAFATKLFGAPTQCRFDWRETPDGVDATLAYRFADGSTLDYTLMPPEISVTKLRAARPFSDPQAARAVIEQEAQRTGLTPDWTKAEVEAEPDGTTRKTYWDPEPGLNAAVDLVYAGEALVGIGLHLAP